MLKYIVIIAIIGSLLMLATADNESSNDLAVSVMKPPAKQKPAAEPTPQAVQPTAEQIGVSLRKWIEEAFDYQPRK